MSVKIIFSQALSSLLLTPLLFIHNFLILSLQFAAILQASAGDFPKD